MVNVENSYGKNAGRIWKTLQENGPQEDNDLLKKTRLKDEDFFAALGWLARENKITKENNWYKLGETNLTWKIGSDAGKVWRVLDTWGEVDIESISRLARINEFEVFTAVGWLAREGKIGGARKGKREKKTKFWLK
jgi:hypothetical protein